MKKIRLGIIREGKVPHDKRVALTPQQCSQVLEEYPGLEIVIQPSDFRCYSNDEYLAFGLTLKEDISDCDILLGIKEVPKAELIPGKTYMFFSHTIKKQPHNRTLLQTVLEKKVSLVDYECLTDKEHNRIIGFGRYAGIVGAYNGLLGYGRKYDLYHLKPAYLCRDREELEGEMRRIKLPNIKIAVTGSGRVANGALEVLGALKIRIVTPFEFLNYSYREPVFTQLHSGDYHAAKDGSPWSSPDFYAHPEKYDSTFERYTRTTDLLLHCSYWDPKAAPLFTRIDMRKPSFHMSVIADISCDINGGIPSTMRASTIESPFYGYNPANEKEDVPFGKHVITVMAVDNLPCELPRDASEDFGKSLMERVFPALLDEDHTGLLERATIARDGHLMPLYEYLSDYVSE
jgi:saccharopine dehydrogenase (NAD+, L-lysine forming)